MERKSEKPDSSQDWNTSDAGRMAAPLADRRDEESAPDCALPPDGGVGRAQVEAAPRAYRPSAEGRLASFLGLAERDRLLLHKLALVGQIVLRVLVPATIPSSRRSSMTSGRPVPGLGAIAYEIDVTHAEMLMDGIIDLYRAGIATGARKLISIAHPDLECEAYEKRLIPRGFRF